MKGKNQISDWLFRKKNAGENGIYKESAGFDDVKKNLLDKGGECKSCIS